MLSAMYFRGEASSRRRNRFRRLAPGILIGLILFSGTARGANARSPNADGGETVYYDTEDADGSDTTGYLRDPIGAFGTGSWPSALNGTQAHPIASLFPWLSGSNNRVTVSRVDIAHTSNSSQGYVLGGLWQGAGGARTNTVTVQNGSHVGKVYGGAAIGDAVGNVVHIVGGATQTTATQVTGGLSVQTTAQATPYQVANNRVVLSGGTGGVEVTGTVTGGWNASGDADGNGQGLGEVTNADTVVHGNQVEIGDNVAIRGNSSNNANVYGGYNEGNSETFENVVKITGGSITQTTGSGGVHMIAGGYGSVIGGDKTEVYGNKVLIEGGTITLTNGTSNYTGIYGGRSQGGTVDVHDNEVSISAGMITTNIVSGGSSGSAIGGSSQAFGNRVNITGGTVTANVAGSRINDEGDAYENRVTLGGGTVIGDVYGAYDGTIGSQNAAITNNDVNLAGGRVEGSIYGGYEDDGTSTGNAVNLYGGTVAENATKTAGTGFVYGYRNNSGGGNTLYGVSGLTNVGGIDRFENAVLRDGSRVNVTGNKNSLGNLGFAATFQKLDNNGLLSFYNDSLDQKVGQINGDYSGNGRIGLEVKFNKGVEPTETDSVVFENAPSSNVVFTFKPASGSELAPYDNNYDNSLFAETVNGDLAYSTFEPGYGIYAYDFRKEAVGSGYRYYVGLRSTHTDDLGKIYTDGSATGLSQIALLADTFLRTGLEQAVASICCPNRGFGISASVGYAAHRIGLGGDGHANLRGFTGQLALAHNRKGTPVNVGLFGEMFDGSYRTSDKVSLTRGVFGRHARGGLESYGGGLFFQYRKRLAEAVEKGIAPAWIPGPHLEAIAHAGWSVLDFATEGDNAPSEFDDAGTPYYGASLGGGYVVDAFPNILADVYGHGRWVRQGGRSAVDGLGQRIELDAADSLRLVAGVRAARRTDGIATPYAGLAAEWEVLGKPGARIDGYEARRADLSGVSALIELGVGIRARDCVYVDLKAYGSVGRRRGIGGVLEVMYAF